MNFNDLLAGTDEIIELKLETVNDTLSVRKINIKETRQYRRIVNEAFGTINTTERSGFRQQRGTEASAEINVADTSDAEYKANVYLIMCSVNIVGEPITEEEINNKLPANVFKELVTKLKELNALNDDVNLEEEVKKH
ncbi:hypothetical protein [Methanosphaera stadtmanae]|uniref:hypothetical protein n=1 Tax=Methanosphaera stadtmanae TaxID=2317 RepID=UPI0026DB619B|nr:hypothetical protein [Methanosphaera stadtmanae]